MKKIILSPACDIPFDRLELSQANVRRVKAGCSIEQLAEDIARRGLIQSLSVRPILDAEGTETGRFEVPAGGRRFRALELLVRAKRLAKSAPVPCVVRAADAPTSATEDSLAENVQREALHPLDQFRAFRTLREEGQSVEDIAARFFVAPAVVHQRLKLVAVSPKLLDLYAEDALTLEQLMAFSVSNDHARQEAVWEVIGAGYSREPWQIRRMLTEGAVRASDRRARFVGIDAYEAAGGVTLRDLFDEDQGGWLQDAGLLEQLALEKLRSEAETIVAEGWKWVDAAPEFPYGHHFGMRLIAATPAALTEVDEAQWEALRAEQARLEEAWEQAEELPDEVDARLGEIEEALAGFESRPAVYDPDEVTRAGAFVCISSAGTLVVERGFVRPEDEPQAEPDPDAEPGEEGETLPAVDPGSGGEAAESAESPEEEELRPLPDRLLGELSAARTLALREALGRTRVIAFQAVLHAFCLSIFYNRTGTGCVEIAIRRPGLAVQGPSLAESAAAQAIDSRHAAWTEQLPDDAAALWEWIRQLGLVEALELFAHCAAQSLNALIEPVSRYGDGHVSAAVLERRLHEADLFADAVSLDMAEAGWVATVDSYFGKVTKPRILEAVREAKGDIAAGRITGLRKSDMAVEAERIVVGSGWLPEVLRGCGYQLAETAEVVDETSEPKELLAAE
ncbi:MAG: ParB/RepB/Spo0J family partition protein [Sphingomonas sp.]